MSSFISQIVSRAVIRGMLVPLLTLLYKNLTSGKVF